MTFNLQRSATARWPLVLALVFLFTGYSAFAVDRGIALDASTGSLVVHVHPGYRTELEFPDRIVKVTGTASPRGQHFVKTGRVLSILPVAWPKGDPRFHPAPSLNVFLPARSYQVDVVPDWSQTQHVFQVSDAAYGLLADQVHGLAQVDQLFIAFVRQQGVLPAAHETSVSEDRSLPNGWTLHVDRAYTYGDWDFLAGTLTVQKPARAITADDLNALNLFPGRDGQVFVPGLDRMAGSPPPQFASPNPPGGPAQFPLFYAYLRRK